MVKKKTTIKKNYIEKYTIPYLSYEQIFGHKSSVQEIQEVIRLKVDIKYIAPILSQLASMNNGPLNKVYKLLNERALYSNQGILNVWNFICCAQVWFSFSITQVSSRR